MVRAAGRLLAMFAMAAIMTAAIARAGLADRPGNALEGNNLSAPAVRPPETGLLCIWALTNAVAEVGRRCRTGQNPAMQAELESALTRMEARVRQSGIREDLIAAFRREQGLSGASDAQICAGDASGMYEHFVRAGPEWLRAETDRAIAQPGLPQWGDCL
jgi:hypothetical protein